MSSAIRTKIQQKKNSEIIETVQQSNYKIYRRVYHADVADNFIEYISFLRYKGNSGTWRWP